MRQNTTFYKSSVSSAPPLVIIIIIIHYYSLLIIKDDNRNPQSTVTSSNTSLSHKTKEFGTKCFVSGQRHRRTITVRVCTFVTDIQEELRGSAARKNPQKSTKTIINSAFRQTYIAPLRRAEPRVQKRPICYIQETFIQNTTTKWGQPSAWNSKKPHEQGSRNTSVFWIWGSLGEFVKIISTDLSISKCFFTLTHSQLHKQSWFVWNKWSFMYF